MRDKLFIQLVVVPAGRGTKGSLVAGAEERLKSRPRDMLLGGGAAVWAWLEERVGVEVLGGSTGGVLAPPSPCCSKSSSRSALLSEMGAVCCVLVGGVCCEVGVAAVAERDCWRVWI